MAPKGGGGSIGLARAAPGVMQGRRGGDSPLAVVLKTVLGYMFLEDYPIAQKNLNVEED